jgi:hypothetical protein
MLHVDSHSGNAFPAAFCPTCRRVVVVYAEFSRDELEHRCVHCDAPLADVFEAGLDALGYEVVPDVQKRGGCATTRSCTLTGKAVSRPGEGGCHGGDCTKDGPLRVV